MERKQPLDDWLAQRLEILRAGWRGRLVLTGPTDVTESTRDELVGTVEGEATLDRDPETDAAIDGEITFCTNYRDGCFVPAAGEARVRVCMSQVEDMHPL